MEDMTGSSVGVSEGDNSVNELTKRVKTFRNIASPQYLWVNTIESLSDVDTHHRLFSIDLLRIFIAANVPLILHGPPGAGKSATIESLCQLTDEDGKHYNVVSIIPSTTDPTVLNGMMFTAYDHQTKKTTMQRSLPDHAVEIRRKFDEEGQLTILMLDEMSTAMISQQHALLNFLTTGKWGELDISGCIAIVMASNPKGTVRVSRELDLQFLNRAGHIPWYSDKEAFMDGWRTGFNRPGKEPSPQAYREIAALMDLSPKDVFRSVDKKWSPETLVPYDDLTMSERTVELYGRVSAVIDDVTGAGKSVNPDVRWMLKMHVAKALFGNFWGDKMKTVMNNEKRRQASAGDVLAASAGLGWGSDFEAVRDAVGAVWGMGGGLSGSVSRSIFDDLVGAVKMKSNSGTLVADDLVALWAFASTTPNGDADFSAFAPSLLPVLKAGKDLYAAGDLESPKAPGFVPVGLRSAIKAFAV